MTERRSMLLSPELSASLNEAAVAPLTFREVYDAHFAFVWRAVANRGVPQAAMDDVVQEVFLVVHRKLPEFEQRSTLRTWLSAIVRRVVADHLKKRGNRAIGQETLDDHAIESSESPAHELEQLTTREIGELTGTNENTVQTRLRAARKTFQRGLERHRASTTRRDA